MSESNERATKVVLVGLAMVGLVQMAFHPVKLWRLLVHSQGWYDDDQ